MNLERFREKLWEYRKQVDRTAIELKESNLALEWLRNFYRDLEASERVLANQVLAEWLLFDDESVRFDALALIGDFRISTALTALDELAARLQQSKSPGAPYELKKVERVVRELRETG
jgi:hypothetical protein